MLQTLHNADTLENGYSTQLVCVNRILVITNNKDQYLYILLCKHYSQSLTHTKFYTSLIW